MRQAKQTLRATVLAAAVASTPLAAWAGVTNDPSFTGPGEEFVVSTSGATALGAFTRARNADGTYLRAPNALGSPELRIGRTVYTIGTGQFFGIADKNAIIAQEPGLNNDRIVYRYHERGSLQGVLDLIDTNGLLLINGQPAPARPQADAQSANPQFINGNRFTLPNTGPLGGYSNGANYDNNANPPAPLPPAQQTGQPVVRIAWTDVRFEQVFSIDGTPGVYKRPLDPGYGKGRGNIGNTNFQRYRDQDVIDGGINPATTRLRNEALAVIPFNLNANPGTGLARVTKEEGAWLQAVGRLPNGANFNVPTRDVGSGTRNQGANNLGIDPTWASGERDRRALASYQGIDADGVVVNINPGDEADPRLSLTGSQLLDLNESRVSPTMRFADKTSGSTGIMPAVRASRMAAGGIVSAGDTGSSGRDLSSSQPVRVLAIDWKGQGNYYQGKANFVTEGQYEMWSASVAVTVAPYANPEANDTAGPGGRPIAGDQIDHAGSVGIHRKWLDNITQSVVKFGTAPTNQTPGDALLATGYILPQIMGVTKAFDGDALTPRTRSNVAPPGGFSEQEIWNLTVGTPGSSINNATNWADPSVMNGNLNGAVRYNLYAPTNTLPTADGNADISIRVNGRTNLAGDLNNDGVRDLQDTAFWALAYANPNAYLATHGGASTNANSTVNDGSSINSTVVSNRSGSLLPTISAGEAGLIVLTDLNSDGNISGTPSNYTVKAVDREDVRYFLYGAAIDTSDFNTPTVVSENGVTKNLTAVQNRRENGVRMGQLRKNYAIDVFNTTLDGYVGTLINPATGLFYTQAQIDALKFNKFDVNNDGQSSLLDAIIVDRNVGKNYTNLADVLSTWDDLIAAELNDDNVITHITPTGGPKSDMQLIVEHLHAEGKLLYGDATLTGTIDSNDFNILAGNFGQNVTRWSQGDFNFDRIVDSNDFNIMAGNFGLSATGGGGSYVTEADWAALAAVVPEPSSLTLLGIAMGFLIRRRRVATGA